MNLETSKKILRIAGILSIIGAVFMFALSAIAIIGGKTVGSNPAIETDQELQQTVAKAFVGSVVFIFVGVAGLVEGIVSYLAGKTGKKGLATVAMVFAVLTSANSISNLIKSGGVASNIFSQLLSIAISLATLYAAYIVRKEADA